MKNNLFVVFDYLLVHIGSSKDIVVYRNLFILNCIIIFDNLHKFFPNMMSDFQGIGISRHVIILDCLTHLNRILFIYPTNISR